VTATQASIPLSEAEWQRQVVQLARSLGWRSYHTMAARRKKGWTTPVTSRGFPDLLLIRPPRIVVAELKTETGVATDEQQEWLSLFSACGVEAYLWRPTDLEQIAHVLSKRFHPPATQVG